jgi:hypothetical protein
VRLGGHHSAVPRRSMEPVDGPIGWARSESANLETYPGKPRQAETFGGSGLNLGSRGRNGRRSARLVRFRGEPHRLRRAVHARAPTETNGFPSCSESTFTPNPGPAERSRTRRPILVRGLAASNAHDARSEFDQRRRGSGGASRPTVRSQWAGLTKPGHAISGCTLDDGARQRNDGSARHEIFAVDVRRSYEKR